MLNIQFIILSYSQSNALAIVMDQKINLKLLEQLSNANQKLIKSGENYIQTRRTDLIQQCFKKNNTNAKKFSKCADEMFGKTQKIMELFQYQLTFAKLSFMECLINKNTEEEKCKQNANNLVAQAKTQFAKDLKSL